MENLSDLSSKPKRKQHRRSISVSRITYDRLRAYCDANNISMSAFVEARVEEGLKNFVPPPRPPEPKPEPRPAPAPKPAKVPTTAAEARAALDPPTHIQKKPAPPADPPKPGLPPSKIFTF